MGQQEIIDFLEQNKGKPMSYKEVCKATKQNKQVVLTSFVKLSKWARKANKCPIKTVSGTMVVNTSDMFGNQTTRTMRVTRLMYNDTQ